VSSSLSTRANIDKYLLRLIFNKKNKEMIDYIKESYSELKNHVTWTTWSEAQRLTVIVAAFSIVLSLIVFGVDTVFSGVISEYFDWIKS
jgi:preprotein translocase subunit SecE